ncbi:hypothetical protein [Clostridium sp. JNZ J1-5]
MIEYLNIKRIVEDVYELVKSEIYQGKFKNYDILYVSDNIDSFDINLFDKYGICKDDIINHVLFEIYAQVIQEELTLEDKKVTLKELISIYFNEYHADDYSRVFARNNCIKLKVKPFLNKYKYLVYRNNFLNNKFDVLWKRSTISRDIFIFDDDLINAMSMQKEYNYVLDFLTPYYGYLIANYAKKYGVFGNLSRYDYDKIDIYKYLNFIDEILKIINKYEKYSNIAFYVLEKEFNIVFISKLVKFINKIQEDDYIKKDRLIGQCLYIILNPICNVEDSLINKIYMEAEIAKKDELVRKYKRYPCNVEIGYMRLSEEFIPLILKEAYDSLRIRYGKDIYNVVDKNKVYFNSLYSNLKEEIKTALDYFNNFKESRNKLSEVMKSKTKLYKTLVRLSSLKNEFYSIKDWEFDDNKKLERIYIMEDYNRIIDNNIILKCYKGEISYKK